jgi:hypothetical protein
MMYPSTAAQIENSVMARVTALRQAERDVAHFGMAFDGATSAEELYRNALEHCGVARQESSGLNLSSLRVLLKHRPMPGSRAWRDAPAMAFDSGEKSVLDDILAD